MSQIGRFIGAVLLVAGTAIGAGMLMLPVSTGLSGFFPATFILLVCWLYMTYTAFLMLEVSLWMPEESSLISMAHSTLGRLGEAVSWAICLFLLYALTTAYIAGGGAISTDILRSFFGREIPQYIGPAAILILLGGCVYRGTAAVDRLNRLLMVGLVLAYGALVVVLTPHVEYQKLLYVHWPATLFGISVAITSFGYHIVIPSLVTYLNRDIKQLKYTLFIGSLIPLLAYLYWQYLALGIIPPQGECSLASGHLTGSDGASLLCQVIGRSSVNSVTKAFAFFAIITSFLGVSLSLYDFLADGLKMQKQGYKKWVLYLLTFGPPILFTLVDPRAFLSALEYAGAFGVVILLALMPALMVWSGRYRHGYKSEFKTVGGKPMLILIIVIALGIIVLECANKLGIV